MMKIERRFIAVEDLAVETRQAEGDSQGGRTIHGYAATFNTPSLSLGGFREVVRPGAFAASVQGGDVRALFNHDPNFVLGRTSAGTLTLKEDDKGLAFRVQVPETSWAKDLITSIERRDITGMSFGFVKRADEWRMEGGVRTRHLLDVELLDVSPVTYPAYPATSVGARSMETELAEFRAMGMEALPEPKQEPDLADIEARRRHLRLAELG